MKKYLFTVILFTTCFTAAFAQDLKIGAEPVFKEGEELSFKLKYGFFTGAEAVIKVEDGGKKIEGHPSYHINVSGKTAGSFDVFYKVRNTYDSYVDRNTLLPYYYTENRKEGSWLHSDNVVFSQQEGKIKADKGVFPFKGKVFDFVSAYYYARNIDMTKLKEGESFKMVYFLEDSLQTLSVTYIGKEQVKSSMGTFNCLKFNPTIIPGRIFRKNSKLYLWITDDGNRIPVKAHVELVVGSVTMDLTGAKGLKYPLNPIKK